MQPAKIGPYPVVRTLGSGAFGTVYLAQHPTAHVPVAIKALDRLQADDSQLRAQLRQEVAALSAVRSPYCLQVSDVIDDGSTLAFVTEYVPGATLRTILDTHGALTAPAALNVLWGAANGLAAVHAAGLVHGDVKPANILLDAHGRSKVIDFGLTSAPGRLRGDELSPYGSPAYASPEQLAYGYRDARSDIYSLSATLYEVLTQQRPFGGRSLVELVAAHTTQPVPDPRALVPDLGDDLAGLILAGLAKDPAHRPQDMTMFLTWFERAATARWGGTWRTAAGLAGIVSVAAVSGLASGVYVASSGLAVTGAAGAAGAAGAGTGVAAGTSASGGLSAAGAGSLLTGKVALIATGTILAVGAATTGIVLATSGGSNTSITTVDYTTAPTIHWHKDWSDLVPGATMDLTTTDGDGYEGVTPMDGAIVVVHENRDATADSMASGVQTMVLSPRDGHLLWKRADVCAPSSDTTVACGGTVFDAASGTTIATVQMATDSLGGSSSVAVTSTAIYAAWVTTDDDGTGNARGVVAQYSVSGGAPLKQSDLRGTPTTLPRSAVAATANNTITASVNGTSNVYDTALNPLVTGDANRVFATDGYKITGPGPVSGGVYTISDPRTGRVLASANARYPWGHGVHQGIGQTYYDLSTGQAVCHGDDFGQESGFTDVNDDGTLIMESNMRTSVYDGQTCNQLWTGDDGDLVGNAVISWTHGDLASTGTVAGINPRADETAWTRDITANSGGEQHPDGVTAAGHGIFAQYGSDGIDVLTGFGTRTTGTGGSYDQTGSTSGGGTAYTTACGSEPVFTPIAAKPGDGGDGEVVTYKVTATCPGGQYLRASQYEVPFYAGESLYLDSYFDFSGNPMFIPDGGTEIALSYPARNTYSDNYEVNKAIKDDNGSRTVIQVPCTPGPNSTEAPAPQAAPSETPSAASAPSSAASELPQTPEQASEDAKAALDRWVRTDRPYIQNYQGQWLTQLSSKGYVNGAFVPADYTSYAQILQTFLRYRQLYPDEARLVWSNDWSGTYGPKSRGLYVLVRAVPYATTDEVNSWCASEQWGRGDCFGTRLATGAFDNSNHSFQPKN